MNVIFVSMARCGVSWIGETISLIHERLYGKLLNINYENDRGLLSHVITDGWNSIYDVDPKILLELGYDKIIIVKRDLETMKEAHAYYQGYLENYGTLERMKEERPAFFERIELQYKLLYEQDDVNNNPKVLLVSLEDLNNYTHSTFAEIITFLDFKLSFIQKVKLFLRVLKDTIRPLVIAVKPENRNWNIYSANLPKGQELCVRLQYLKKIEIEVKENE